jgi:N-acetylglutamate synthase-like GNAT family acetyltransferase
MIKLSDYENIDSIKVVDLREEMLEEALAVFASGGWDEDSLKSVQVEMRAFLKGDIEGYIRQRFVVALLHDSVVGVAAWAPSICAFSLYELSWATILPEWRHRGINALLLKERIKKIKSQHGTKSFEVLVYTWDNPMYAEQGFLPQYRQDNATDRKKEKQVLVARFHHYDNY